MPKARKIKPATEVVANPEREDDMPEIYVTATVRLKVTNTHNAKRGSIFMCSASSEVRREENGPVVGTVSNAMGTGLVWNVTDGPTLYLSARDAWIALMDGVTQAQLAEAVVKFEDWAGRIGQ